MTKAKKKFRGVSYTNRDGKRIHVYSDDFKNQKEYLDRAENIILFAKNPRTLKSFRKIEDFYPKPKAAKSRKARR